MITKRTLERYRIDALSDTKRIHSDPREGLSTELLKMLELDRRILRLTQELLDLELLRKRQKL